VVGFTTGSRGEVPGKKENLTRNDDDDNNNNICGEEILDAIQMAPKVGTSCVH
jgi:hypothetical protein